MRVELNLFLTPWLGPLYFLFGGPLILIVMQRWPQLFTPRC